jgi:hypothetical protein
MWMQMRTPAEIVDRALDGPFRCHPGRSLAGAEQHVHGVADERPLDDVVGELGIDA